MDLIEITHKERLKRKAVAAQLHELADQLDGANVVEFERGGVRLRAHVPDELDLKVEFEVDEDGTELEIELTW